MKRLKHHAKMQPFGAQVLLLPRDGMIRIKQSFPPHRDGAVIRRLQKIQTAQKRRLAGAGGTDNRQRAPLLQIKAHVIEHSCGIKMFSDMFHF